MTTLSRTYNEIIIAFEKRYESNWNDPENYGMRLVFIDGWIAALESIINEGGKMPIHTLNEMYSLARKAC